MDYLKLQYFQLSIDFYLCTKLVGFWQRLSNVKFLHAFRYETVFFDSDGQQEQLIIVLKILK